jgi:hypothetical protein
MDYPGWLFLAVRYGFVLTAAFLLVCKIVFKRVVKSQAAAEAKIPA